MPGSFTHILSSNDQNETKRTYEIAVRSLRCRHVNWSFVQTPAPPHLRNPHTPRHHPPASTGTAPRVTVAGASQFITGLGPSSSLMSHVCKYGVLASPHFLLRTHGLPKGGSLCDTLWTSQHPSQRRPKSSCPSSCGWAAQALAQEAFPLHNHPASAFPGIFYPAPEGLPQSRWGQQRPQGLEYRRLSSSQAPIHSALGPTQCPQEQWKNPLLLSPATDFPHLLPLSERLASPGARDSKTVIRANWQLCDTLLFHKRKAALGIRVSI